MNMKFKGLLFFLVVVIAVLPLKGQAQKKDEDPNKKYVQFSGMVLTVDSLMPLSYVSIYIPHTTRGTISDLNGFFSFVAQKGDTVTFSSIGYKTVRYKIPDSLSSQKYSMVVPMTEDTMYLTKVFIRPLPSREIFDYYFVKVEIPDDDLERARKNLDREKMKEYRSQMGMDGGENTQYHLQQQAQKFYYAGQIPPMNIFSPIAWAKFFEAWKKGDFKKRE
jgi:hypothetical protein